MPEKEKKQTFSMRLSTKTVAALEAKAGKVGVDGIAVSKYAAIVLENWIASGKPLVLKED